MDLQKELTNCNNWILEQDDDFVTGYGQGNYALGLARLAWQAAKAQAVPETKKFNLDEFLLMEQKLKSKGGIIKADLDCFIAYAEMVLEKAKALKEPK